MVIVLQGYAAGSLYWFPGGAGGAGPSVAATATGKLVHPILTHHSTITTSWWWLMALTLMGHR